MPGAENQGNQGPRPSASRHPRHATRPAQVKRRGQHAFLGEGGGPDGGAGATGGEMAATLKGYSRGFVKLAQDAADGDPAAIALAGNRDSANYRAVVGPFETGTTKDMVRHFDFDIHDTGTSGDPSEHDDRTTDEVARLLALADNVMGRDKPHGSVNRHAPKTVAARNAAEARALAGGRAQNPIER